LVPIRNFTYVNLGPSYNLGPAIGWGGDLEIGTNVRLEQTSSVLGNLTGTDILGSIRAEILPAVQLTAAYEWRGAQGTEAGVGGELVAAYPYLYDNSALGAYTPVTVNNSRQTVYFSTAFKVNKNSTIYLDYDWIDGAFLDDPSPIHISDHFGRISYEIKF
jgi:hypothetical protein